MPYLFAHGNIRKGFEYNTLVAGGACLGTTETAEHYALCIIREKPVIIKRTVSTIKGEVYSVTDEVLKQIDRVEGHPHVNRREAVSLKLPDNSVVEAWLYFHVQPLRDYSLVESGDYSEFKRKT
jgi:gamma-glutamylcyclotransferase (GGCT)/AIG2-like uncharacterized protein YtfP